MTLAVHLLRLAAVGGAARRPMLQTATSAMKTAATVQHQQCARLSTAAAVKTHRWMGTEASNPAPQQPQQQQHNKHSPDSEYSGRKLLRKAKPRRPSDRAKEAAAVKDVAVVQEYRCSAKCVAEAFDLAWLRKELDPSFYTNKQLISDQNDQTWTALYSPIPDDGHVFFFADGTFVVWRAPDTHVERCLFDSKNAQIGTYPEKQFETEEMNYVENADPFVEPGMVGETIALSSGIDPAEIVRERLAFSNGLAASAKLAVLEERVEDFLEKNRHIPQIMQDGRELPLSRKEVFQQIGALLNFRGKLNLHSELLEVPDFYWSEPKLEELYRSMSRTLDVPHRISILNKKLDYANELIEVLRTHLSEVHSLKLEWMIIALIAVEVGFEFVHYADRLGKIPWFS